jgi:hypothetical protein
MLRHFFPQPGTFPLLACSDLWPRRGQAKVGPAPRREFDMRFVSIIALSAVIFTSSMALAQNAGTGSATPSGDSAVSPATVNPAGGSNGTNRSSLGAGVNSGAMNNGTTGDTIGTGPGTSSGPSTGQAPTNPVPDRR